MFKNLELEEEVISPGGWRESEKLLNRSVGRLAAGTMPIWTAISVKDAALCTPSFCITRDLWLSTVFVATPSSLPISLLDLPSAIDCMTSTSLADRACADPHSGRSNDLLSFGE